MNTRQDENVTDQIEAVVGVFDNATVARTVAAELKSDGLSIQRVSRSDSQSSGQVSDLVYDDIEEIGTDNVASGMIKGGAIGAGSGLVFLGVPGLNLIAPVVGAIFGAWIGCVAEVDEANRAIETPKETDYRKLIASGKSLLVISGTESERIEFANRMKERGAEEVHQHPPVRQAIHKAVTKNA